MQSTFLHYFTLTEQKNKHHFERFKPHVQECRESFTSSNIEKLLSVNNLGKQYRTCQLEPSDWIFYHFFHFVSSFVNSFFLAHYIRLYCPRHLINFNDFSFHTWSSLSSALALVELLIHPARQSHSYNLFNFGGIAPVTDKNLLPTREGRAFEAILPPKRGHCRGFITAKF